MAEEVAGLTQLARTLEKSVSELSSRLYEVNIELVRTQTKQDALVASLTQTIKLLTEIGANVNSLERRVNILELETAKRVAKKEHDNEPYILEAIKGKWGVTLAIIGLISSIVMGILGLR